MEHLPVEASACPTRCPITSRGICRFSDQLTTDSFPQPYAFYAFDTATSCSSEKQLRSRAIRSEVELAVKECGFDFYAFDRDRSSGSIDWLCEHLCLRIRNAALVIADVSCYEEKNRSRYTCNPNVTFELGMAWGFCKPLMLISGTGAKTIAADLRPIELYLYPDDFTSQKFKQCLHSVVNAATVASGFELITSKSLYAPILRQLETCRGCDWLLASDYHSFLYRPLSNLKRIAQKTGKDPADVKRRQEIVEQRWNNLRSFLDENSEFKLYEIYEWEGMRDYFSTGLERRKTSPNPWPITREELVQEVTEAKQLLQKHHPKLQIVFTNRSLPYAFICRPGHCVVIDSKSDLPDTLNGIVVTYRAIVDQLCKSFWDFWKEVPSEEKQLRTVLSRYDELLKLTNNVKQ